MPGCVLPTPSSALPSNSSVTVPPMHPISALPASFSQKSMIFWARSGLPWRPGPARGCWAMPGREAARACPRCGGPVRRVLTTRQGRPGWFCDRCRLYSPDWLARIAAKAEPVREGGRR